MAWSKQNKNHKEEHSNDEGVEWIYLTPIDTAIERVRETWKDKGIHAENSDWGLVQLAHIAVMRGQTRRTAHLIVRLLEKREADGKLRWNLDPSSIGAVGISMVRLMAAYLEDPAVSYTQARAAVEMFLRSIESHDELKTVRQLMPFILAVRLDKNDAGSQSGRSAKKLPLRAEMEVSGMCAAAQRQWRVEYLLAKGAEMEALELAHKGRGESPCGHTCAFAPHSMFAWLLEPLRRHNRRDEAQVLSDRLEALLTPRLLYLDAMGCRIHYLAHEGDYLEADRLIRAMLPLAEEADASPWQRLKFYNGCVKAFDALTNNGHWSRYCDTAPDSPEVIRTTVIGHRDELRKAFDDREV